MKPAPQSVGEPPPPECEHLSELADQLARLHPVQEPEPAPEPAVRGEDFLRRLENGFLRFDRLVERALPAALNPFAQLGAMANTCLIIAVISGVLLLFWYTPSVHQAYDSLERLRDGSFVGQWLRSLHRYSSDGCVLFILLHAVRIVFQRRFTGARWLAWTTGILLLAGVWFIGWTGYWLVWDVRGQHAALGTARFLDRLPIFAEPVSRSFLTDQSVPSLLFFIVFFLHMLLPLALGVGLWMHLMRVNRARFLTGRTMTAWILGSLAVLAVLRPAVSAGPARMLETSAGFTLDWWYLWPFVLTDRLGGGMLWAGFLGAGLVTLAVPWWMVKRRRAPAWKAEVELARCFGCTHCAQDCPFNAITMIPREDGKPFVTQASVDPALCVGCGICTGSCDSQAINLPALNSRALEKRLAAWIDAEKGRGRSPFLAFACAESGAAGSRVGADRPGWRIENVPCAGWVSAVLLERLLRRGAAGVLVAGCGAGDPVAREGHRWTEQRLTGLRDPAFDPRKAGSDRVRFVPVSRTDHAAFGRAAGELENQAATARAVTAPASSRWRRIAAGVVLSVVLSGVTWAFSDLPYRPPGADVPELVVSFHHAGAVVQPRRLTAAELEQRLPHMRAQVHVTRERSPIRLRVWLDGTSVFDESFRPKGLSKDGPSVGTLRLPVSADAHHVRVEITDVTVAGSADAAVGTGHQWEATLQFQPGRKRVVLFNTRDGFMAY